MSTENRSRQRGKLVGLRLAADQDKDAIFGFAEFLIDALHDVTEQRNHLRAETEPARKRNQDENDRLRVALTKAHDRADRLSKEVLAKPDLHQAHQDVRRVQDALSAERRLRGDDQLKIRRLENEIRQQNDRIITAGVSRKSALDTLNAEVTRRGRRTTELAIEAVAKDNEIAVLKSRVRGDLYDDMQRRVEAQEVEIERLDKNIVQLTLQLDKTRTIATESMVIGDWAYRSKGNQGIDTIDRLRGSAWENVQRTSSGYVHKVSQNIRAGDEVELVSYLNGEWLWRKKWTA
jgi:hypothetical protein